MKEIEFLSNVDLKDFCTMRVGGKAKFLYIAKSNKALIKVCKHCYLHNIKYKIIGLGANLIFSDLGFDGAIIVNRSNKILHNNSSLIADGGVTISEFLNTACENNLGGMENLFGIPATVAGAIFNNLSSFDCEFSHFLEYVEVYDIECNKLLKLNNIECKFEYRNSLFKSKNYIILRAKINLTRCNKTIIKEKMLTALARKKDSQPLEQFSSGSVFKRGKIIASKVIDELGLKGKAVGEAIISNKHAGFIVNLGNAKSCDILKLISFIKEKVKSATQCELEEEIEFVDY